jgi:hypothetical protein
MYELELEREPNGLTGPCAIAGALNCSLSAAETLTPFVDLFENFRGR